VIDLDRVFGGTDVHLTFETGPLTTHVGLEVQTENEHRRGFENFIGTTLGVQGALRRDETNTVYAIDPYVQSEWHISDAWQLYAGLRASRTRFKSEDHYIVPGNGDDSGAKSFAAANPAAGLAFKPNSSTTTYVSYGRGFETPTLTEAAYRADPVTLQLVGGLNTDLRASRSNNWEIGLKDLWTPKLRTTLALFTIRTSDELVVATNAGGRSSFTNATRTRRDGVEAEVVWRPSEALSFIASGAAVNARYDADFTTCLAAPCSGPVNANRGTIPKGNKLPGVPARSVFVEAKYRNAIADVSLEGRALSKIFVNDANSDQASAYAIASASVAHTFQVGATKPRVFARVDNLFDRQYVGSVIVNESNSRFFEPALGRTWLVGVDWPL
jgi:iron complex outermembrane receptor protein